MFIEIDDAQIFAVDYGFGPRTLLGIGGWTGSWEVYADTFISLSRGWRTVAYDHRGSGATIAPVASIRFETMVEDLFAVLDALRIERCVLAAESAGAMVALQAALQQPQRFEGLVLLAAYYHSPAPAGPNPFVQGLKSHYAATVGAFVDQCAPGDGQANIRHWGRQILMRAEPEAAIQLLTSFYGVDLRSQVAQISQRTLIIHGEADQIVPVDAAVWLASQIPSNRLVLLPGAGHVPSMTHAQRVADAINEFFV